MQSHIARLGGLARAKQFTPDFQRYAQSCRSRESLVAAGKLGYAATCARHGRDLAARCAAAFRRAHPTRLHRTITSVLDTLAIPYHSEVLLPGTSMYIDILLDTSPVAIEIDGRYYHDPATAPDPRQPQRDQVKATRLAEQHIRLIRLTDDQVNTTSLLDDLRRLIDDTH